MANQPATKSAPKSAKPDDNPPAQPQGNVETRCYQETPGTRVWLTKAEAESKGLYWKEDKPAPKKPA